MIRNPFRSEKRKQEDRLRAYDRIPDCKHEMKWTRCPDCRDLGPPPEKEK